MSAALAKLRAAEARTGAMLSVGLEPCPEYQFGGLPATLDGYEQALHAIVDATRGIAAAYKFNLAFFEALGPGGFALLHRVRAALPVEAVVIADAKRSDIGSSAARYAQALYGELGADCVTVNPLMGRDSVEPFLAYEDRLTILLCLTSNPGACDFLVPGRLYRHIAEKAVEWSGGRGNCGLVVGATQPGSVAEIRAAAGDLPFLIPGVGAQGGTIEQVVRDGRIGAEFSGLLFHVTRGILPRADEAGEAAEVIRRKAGEWQRRIADALKEA
ncbi:MAG: orotidine-5-phosphate decarboxylase [Candidatus Sumerlaeota bacterium]|nr:orotidine-5-phosphate decarboxylase [Candidatus Sumerlaeota bacterium]